MRIRLGVIDDLVEHSWDRVGIMPSEISTSGLGHDREPTVEELKRELAEAREQQSATAEILRVISSSADPQRVFADIAASAARLCEAFDAGIFQVEGELLRRVVHDGPIAFPDTLPLTREVSPGRAVLDRRTIHIADLQAEADEFPDGSIRARHLGFRTILNVPLIRAGEAMGVISIRRTDVRPFTDRQIDLLKTFADQAVIAIEHTRLFVAEQASRRDLQESLEYQTAISDVLNVISRSPNDLQPVFDIIAQNASRLCGGEYAIVTRYDGSLVHLVAQHNPRPGTAELTASLYPLPADPKASPTSRAIATISVIHVPDVELEDLNPTSLGLYRRISARAILAVPMVHKGHPIGTVSVSRASPGSFSDHQIELLKTFADQAVIAIENTRLFEEVQARNRALADANKQLTETLEQQTATSKILRVISRSPTDVQPVFESTVESAARLCDAERALIYRFDGKFLRLAASHNASPQLIEFINRNPISPGRHSNSARAALERQTLHIPDAQADAEYTYGVRHVDPIRSTVAVPMLKGNVLLGVIVIYRLEVRPFTNKQISLVETFADQAAIAISNVGLFEEVQARNRDLTALGEVGRAVSSTLDLKVVLKTIVDRAVELSGTDAGSIYYYWADTERFELGEAVGLDEDIITRLRKLDIAAKDSGLGEAISLRMPLLIADMTKRKSNPLRAAAIQAGFRAALIVPLLGSEGPLGALVLQRRQPGEFPETVVSLMQSFADQSAIALENARLFEEIALKSRELEIASQHKSQFVANMSHELRTPLAAILGFAELIQEGFYGPLPDKSMDALTRIRSNGKHLLGLINTVLDIAKIESGQFTLNMAEYAIESVVETVRSATESLAQNKKLALTTEVAGPLPIGLGDEQRLTQVLLNLVGNAIKFTDSGEVRVTAKAVNGHFAVSVMDTGPGIPEQEQKRIFEQFHQIDSSLTKAKGGTGLGLAIAKQIVEMHGGRIWVESTPGNGATFQIELPARAELRKSAP